MSKRIPILIFSALLLLNVYGCIAILAGAAAGAGTAKWMSDKLTQQVSAPYDRTVTATESALKSMNLVIDKESREADVTTFRSHYTDGKEIWIDVRRIAENSTKVEVRVGAVQPDKDACSKILSRIKSYL